MAEPAGDRPGSGLVADVTASQGSFTLTARLAVPPGGVLAVVGPNGAGKTTLLRALAGLLAVDRGRIAIDGDLLADSAADLHVPVAERRVGVVFQDYRLFPHLSAVDNVAFGARARGVPARDARRDAARWLDRMDLSGVAARRPARLSGGQAQRVALARALAGDPRLLLLDEPLAAPHPRPPLAGDPRLLLLDEPLAALDARTRGQVRADLRRHLREFGGPSVLVTHDPLEALVLADAIAVLERGSVVQEGTPAQVARRPATDYVARLVGLNLYAGTARDRPAVGGGGRGGAVTVDLDDGGVLVAGDVAGDVASDVGPDVTADVKDAPADRLLVALAPAAISVHAGRPGPGSARNVWPGSVEGIEVLTDRVRLAVRGEPPALVDVTAAAVTDLDLVPGRQVWLSAKATEVQAYPSPG